MSPADVIRRFTYGARTRARPNLNGFVTCDPAQVRPQADAIVFALEKLPYNHAPIQTIAPQTPPPGETNTKGEDPLLVREASQTTKKINVATTAEDTQVRNKVGSKPKAKEAT